MSKYVIVDLEMCNVPKTVRRAVYHCRNEIIQIGAVLVDESLEIAGEFVTYVKPQFGTIDAYIEELTGISRKDVLGAPCIKDALERFMSWVPDDAVMVSWSMSDESQIRKETEAKNIVIDRLQEYLESWVDCQKTFGEKMDNQRSYKLSEALIIANIDYDDGEHDALVDSKNTAQLFIKMEREPVMSPNPYLLGQTEETAHCPLAKLLANYKPAC